MLPKSITVSGSLNGVGFFPAALPFFVVASGSFLGL